MTLEAPASPAAEEAPFGAFRTTPFEEGLRRFAGGLPRLHLLRKAATALLGPAGGRPGRAFDVEIFGGARARLHPYDNICEKRVYLTPQYWDPEERAALARAIALHRGGDFHFVDVGANVGLYSLFALAEARRAGVRLKALAIEPDAEMRRRLAFNIAASTAASEISVAPYAVAGRDGRARFAVNAASRGMSRLADSGETEVEARTLARIVQECGFSRIDAMKLDIEGAEAAALAPYLADAATPRPAIVILETSHAGHDGGGAALLAAAGYRAVLETRLNSVFARVAG